VSPGLKLLRLALRVALAAGLVWLAFAAVGWLVSLLTYMRRVEAEMWR